MIPNGSVWFTFTQLTHLYLPAAGLSEREDRLGGSGRLSSLVQSLCSAHVDSDNSHRTVGRAFTLVALSALVALDCFFFTIRVTRVAPFDLSIHLQWNLTVPTLWPYGSKAYSSQ